MSPGARLCHSCANTIHRYRRLPGKALEKRVHAARVTERRVLIAQIGLDAYEDLVESYIRETKRRLDGTTHT